MPNYIFTGIGPEDFLDFGTLQPGQKIVTQEPVDHARLKLVVDPKAAPSKVEANPANTA